MVHVSDQGICVFRRITGYDSDRLRTRYKVDKMNGMYISYIVKVNKKVAGFAGYVFTEIKAKLENDLYLEVNKNNLKAMRVYESLGFTMIGRSSTQHLYVHKGKFS